MINSAFAAFHACSIIELIHYIEQEKISFSCFDFLDLACDWLILIS
jgi:hypothetical protein